MNMQLGAKTTGIHVLSKYGIPCAGTLHVCTYIHVYTKILTTLKLPNCVLHQNLSFGMTFLIAEPSPVALGGDSG